MCLHVACKEYVHFFGGKCIVCLQKGANKLVVVAFWRELTGKPLKLYLSYIFFFKHKNKISYVQSLCPI